jgi:predicted Zn-dependent protease with MMP-like domain
VSKRFSGKEFLERVVRFLDRGQFGDAQVTVEEALRRAPDCAECHHALGLVLTQLGQIPEADRAFARAARLHPADYFPPYRLGRGEFEDLVEEVLASLPTEFARHLENVEVAVEAVPGRNLLREEGIEHDLLGFYQGETIESGEWGFPDRILLFQRNLENISPDRETLVREVRDTVLHEVGHHLGMDEDQLEEIESDREDLAPDPLHLLAAAVGAGHFLRIVVPDGLGHLELLLAIEAIELIDRHGVLLGVVLFSQIPASTASEIIIDLRAELLFARRIRE